ncbi:MAG TPA: MlaD family protein [Steroidobacteraceae bacterium]|nr:MlaD family protein [Steroidobacteraceae bacterium]
MDREAKYVAVGAFVLLVLLFGAGFVLWYSNAGDAAEQKRYEIYFEGSVSGLSEGSSVRYLGVVVGRVAHIGIDPREARRVRVVTDIDAEAPIGADTVARLTLQGVTGLLFVDLRPRSPGTLPGIATPSLKFPVIPSEQSQFDVLVSSLPDVVTKAGETLERINAMLSDANIKAVSDSLAHAERASQELPMAVAEAREMFGDLQDAANEMDKTMAALGTFGGEDIKGAATRLREVADTIAVTASRFDRMVAKNEGNVDRFASQGLAEIEQLLREARTTMRSVDELTRSLERDPSRVIFGPAPSGVEIPP